MLLHASGWSSTKESLSETEAAYGLLLRGGVLHVFEVDTRVLWLSLEMSFLRLWLLLESMRAGPRGDCHYQCERWLRW